MRRAWQPIGDGSFRCRLSCGAASLDWNCDQRQAREEAIDIRRASAGTLEWVARPGGWLPIPLLEPLD